MSARVSLDTNILAYAVDPRDPAKHLLAKSLLARAAIAGCVLTQQVIGEYFNFALKRTAEHRPAVRESADRLMRAFTILPTAPTVMLTAFDRAARYNLQYWDTVIISVCLTHGVTHLLSEDMQDGMNADGLTILNPFNSTNADVLDILLPEQG